MLRPVQFFRLLRINIILMRHGFTRTVLGPQSSWLRTLSYFNPLSFFPHAKTRGESVRIALERLGPIFVKFGQLLSTRRDLLPEDIADELAKLQDRVPPFSSTIAKLTVEKAFNHSIYELFSTFEDTPLASASIAQVHAATLHDGAKVIVKILRPKIKKIIRKDIAILYHVARLTEKLWKHGKRLHPVEIVAEFEHTLLDELDLMREAANATQLRRNFVNSKMLYVPKIYWDYTRINVLTMERIYGVPIANINALKAKGTNLKVLAEYGVEIFFTQVFRDGFFHADMHPGNLFVDVSDPEFPKYNGVDFGIMGTLSTQDQYYLAENLLAFFNRNYRRVAILHIESGWVPPNTRVDQFEAAFRTVCEPIFEKPLKEISFGQLLLRLLQTTRRFKMEAQPQLMLLQKTLLAIEGLGRQLYPDLDLWATAKPFMTKWMRKQHSLSHIAELSLQDWQESTTKFLKTPQLFYNVLHEINMQQRYKKYTERMEIFEKEHLHSKKNLFLGIGIGIAIVLGLSFITQPHIIYPWQWATGAVAAGLLLVGALQ